MKGILLLALLLMLSLCFVSCGDDDPAVAVAGVPNIMPRPAVKCNGTACM